MVRVLGKWCCWSMLMLVFMSVFMSGLIFMSMFHVRWVLLSESLTYLYLTSGCDATIICRNTCWVFMSEYEREG